MATPLCVAPAYPKPASSFGQPPPSLWVWLFIDPLLPPSSPWKLSLQAALTPGPHGVGCPGGKPHKNLTDNLVYGPGTERFGAQFLLEMVCVRETGGHQGQRQTRHVPSPSPLNPSLDSRPKASQASGLLCVIGQVSDPSFTSGVGVAVHVSGAEVDLDVGC